MMQDNKDCKPANPQVIGPILEGEEVIIAASSGPSNNRVFGFLAPVRTGEAPNQFTSFRIIDPNNIANDDSTDIVDNVPKYQIWYFSDSLSTNPNPFVFFTLSNENAVNKSGRCNGGCDGVTSNPRDGLPFPGISATFYPSTSTISSDTRYLAPGTPTPLQLVPANNERTWFPLTVPTVGDPDNVKYVLGLSNVGYTINAFISGNTYQNIALPASFEPRQSGDITVSTVTNLATASGSQVYYLIPTKYYTSNRGTNNNVSLCKDCEKSGDGGLGAFCSIGCRLSTANSTSDSGICCDSSCTSGNGLDCTKVCQYGFTSKTDCRDACFYRYCKNDESECTGDCKSACSPTGTFANITQTCTFTGAGFVCTSPTGVTGTNLPLTSTDVAIIVVVTVVILAIIFYVIYTFATEYNRNTT